MRILRGAITRAYQGYKPEILFRIPLMIDIIWKDNMATTPTGKYRMIRREFEVADENGGPAYGECDHPLL